MSEGLQLHDKRHFVDPLLLRCSNPLPRVKLFMYSDLVACELAGGDAWSSYRWHDWLHRDHVPRVIVDMPARLELLDKEIELFTVKLLIERL